MLILSLAGDIAYGILRADGARQRKAVIQAIMGACSVWLDTGRQETVRTGRWFAGNGWLYLIDKGDHWTVYRYRVAGKELRLTCDGKGEL